MKCFITGGAGFIGSHIVDRLIKKNYQVTVYDNLSLGKKNFLNNNFKKKNFKFIKGDILDLKLLTSSSKNFDIVFHLAANSDIIKSFHKTNIDIHNGTIGTYNVLEAMRKNNIHKIIFTSSNVVYGETKKLPIFEDQGPLFPISLYGASKLASEALISAYSHNFKIKSWIFRFGNVLGSRITHGVIYDFFKKLKSNQSKLNVLGNGKQSKPYILVDDLIDGIFLAIKKSKNDLNYFNLSSENTTNVNFIAKKVLQKLKLDKTKIIYSGGKRGWPGDVSRVQLNVNKIKKLGWKPKYLNSNNACEEGIERIIDYLLKNKY